MTHPQTEAERVAAIDRIVAGLSDGEKQVMGNARFVDKGWEPPNPFAPILCRLVEKRLFTRADGRCGFEAFKDSFIVPTDLGLAVRAALMAKGEG